MQKFDQYGDKAGQSDQAAVFYRIDEVDARIAELERVREAASRYFKNWCMDEAYDSTVCCEQQHEEAKALRDALNACL